jgi:hypothetical protein
VREGLVDHGKRILLAPRMAVKQQVCSNVPSKSRYQA